MRKSVFNEQVVTKDGRKQDNSYAVEYFTGADIHFTILSNAKDILKIIKTITSRASLNNLEKVEDSVQLLLVLA